MIGNGTFWAIADAAQGVNSETTNWSNFDVRVRTKDIRIGRDVVRSLLVFECPELLCAVELFQICDACVLIRQSAATIESVQNHWGSGEENS